MFVQYYFLIAMVEELNVNVPLTLTPTVRYDCSYIQLPKIQIPGFNGNILRWITFRDICKSLVHENKNLSSIEKYHYLVVAVSESPSVVIFSISLLDFNYIVVWNALYEHFDNPRLIMNSHMDNLSFRHYIHLLWTI